MKAAFYKNWKKLALVLTSMFWASCGDDSSSTAPTTSSESSSSVEASSSDITTPSSSSEAPASSNENAKSSSNANATSSASEPASSSIETITSSSGPDSRITCTEATLERTFNDKTYNISGLKCEDGEEYELEAICPDYGINLPCSEAYIGKNKRYSAEEFKKIYKVAKANEISSSSSVPASSSSTPASSANESSSSVNPENLIACVDTTLDRKSGNRTYKNKGVACADNKKYLVDEMCPLYGVGLSCSRSYTDDNGTTYSEDEFQNIYKIVKELPNSSSSAAPASSNSSEKIACAKATFERYEGLPCDGEICPAYGVISTEVEGFKCEDGVEYEMESICPKYGIDKPCQNEYIGNNGKKYSEEEFKKIYEIDSRQ